MTTKKPSAQADSKHTNGIPPVPAWLHRHGWLSGGDLKNEVVQAEQEGRDLSRIRPKIAALQAVEDAARDAAWFDRVRLLSAEIQSLPIRKGYAYEEPSDYAGILAARGKPRVEIKTYRGSQTHFREQLDAGWNARIVGCLLGKPIEGWSRDHIIGAARATDNWPISGYFHYPTARAMKKLPADHPYRKHDATHFKHRGMGITNGMIEDDDTNYTVANFAIVKQYGANFTPENVADFWLSEMPILHTCTAERIAYRNLCNGYPPPVSAIVGNPYREWIGAQIRADYFGYANPGNPERAAAWAWRDASISHVKNGIYGEMWAAAAIAAAYVEHDPSRIIRAGLDQIPLKSRFHEDIERVLKLHADHADFDTAVEIIRTQWNEKSGDWCHTNSNAQLVTAAILWNADSLNNAIGAVISCGFDTDCNGATVGSILGIRNGILNLRPEWRAPIKDRITTGIAAYRTCTISLLSDEMATVARDCGGLVK